jgi:SAM-dependent methyltransferase
LVLARFYWRHRFDFVFYRRLEKRAMLPWLNLKPGERVCELGSFTGADARRFSGRFGCTIWGLDLSQRYVRLAQAFNKTERTRFLAASAEFLPFASESFDKIYGVSVLEHFTDGQRALQEAYRCLKRGGILVFTTDSFALGEIWPGTQTIHRRRYSVRRYYSERELVEQIEAAGFELVHAEPVIRHWTTGFLLEFGVHANGVKLLASLLLPILRWIEETRGSRDRGYMEMVCAVKPPRAGSMADAYGLRRVG